MLKIREGVEGPLAKSKGVLAWGDISFVVRSYLSCSALSASTWTEIARRTGNSAWPY